MQHFHDDDTRLGKLVSRLDDALPFLRLLSNESRYDSEGDCFRILGGHKVDKPELDRLITDIGTTLYGREPEPDRYTAEEPAEERAQREYREQTDRIQASPQDEPAPRDLAGEVSQVGRTLEHIDHALMVGPDWVGSDITREVIDAVRSLAAIVEEIARQVEPKR